jgi:threonine dehydrogenase-like Zn-dependent dehydrogenase
VTVNRPRQELYDFWRDFTNFPQFMDNIRSVEELDAKRSRWVIEAPAGTSIEFVSRITEEEAGRLIAWESEEGASVGNSGRSNSRRGARPRHDGACDDQLRSAGRHGRPARRQAVPAGAERAGPPDMRRFKQLMETGEITSSASPSGRNPKTPPSRRFESSGEIHACIDLARPPRRPRRHRSRSRYRQSPRRDHQGHVDRRSAGSDLAPLLTATSDDAAGDIMGTENMGEVVEVGAKSTLKKGQRVVHPVHISCGRLLPLAASSSFSPATMPIRRPRQTCRRRAMVIPMGAAFGFSHLTGGYAGRPGGISARALIPTSVRSVIPDGLGDDKVLFLSDILADRLDGRGECRIEPGDHDRRLGLRTRRPVRDSISLRYGAHRVIAIDHYPRRLELAKQMGAEILDFREVDVRERSVRNDRRHRPLMRASIASEWNRTGLASTTSPITRKVWLKLGPDRPAAFRQAILACRKGGRSRCPASTGGMIGQVPDRRLHGKRPDDEDGPDPCSEIYEAAAGDDRGGQARHDLHDLAPRKP